MKVGILTHQLYTNYGGILQNYALQCIIKKLGHQVETIDYQKDLALKMKILSCVKRFLLKYVLNKNVVVRGWPTFSEKNIISRNTRNFVDEYIKTSKRIRFKEVKSLSSKYDCVIVGSDQVWRKKYLGKNIDLMFLSTFPRTVKKIAYAASFGINYWDYTEEETNKCKQLIRDFDGVSVREKSGVSLCHDFLDCKAVHVLDPTMLLHKEDYMKIIVGDEYNATKKGIMCYFLDETSEKIDVMKFVEKKLYLPVYSINATAKFSDCGAAHIEKCVFPPIPEWLRGFRDADFVITDSFHGTVFSIIFNKPFLTIMNKERGADRFLSLLGMFGLEHRLVTSMDEISLDLLRSMDYTKINQKWEELRVLSTNFLKEALS